MQPPIAGAPDPYFNPVTDIRTLLPQLKEILSSATHADDAAIFEIWVQLCRAIAFFGPSSDRIHREPIASSLRLVVAAAETFVGVAYVPSLLGRGEDQGGHGEGGQGREVD